MKCYNKTLNYNLIMAQVKSNITFIIFTYNEKKRIEYPIKCFLPYGEVIVSDDSSTDNTVKIAQKLGAKVLKRKVHGAGFVENKEEVEFIFSHVKTDWVFWGFADDMAPKTCLELYKKISQENKYKIVVQKRKTLMYDGKSELHPGLISTKFFREDSLDFSDNTIHQMGKFAPHVQPAEVLYLPPIDEYATYHFSLETTESLMSKINLYSTTQAKSTQGRISLIKLISAPLIIFIETYFFNGSWKYGIKGYISSMRFAMGYFVTLSKKYEMDNNITLSSMEKKFTKEKKKLLLFSPRSNIFKKIWAYLLIFFLSRLHKKYKFGKKKS